MVAEVVLERDVDRTGQMALQIRSLAVGLIEPPAHVEDRHGRAGVDQTGQLGGGDQHAYGLNPRSCRASTQPASQSLVIRRWRPAAHLRLASSRSGVAALHLAREVSVILRRRKVVVFGLVAVLVRRAVDVGGRRAVGRPVRTAAGRARRIRVGRRRRVKAALAIAPQRGSSGRTYGASSHGRPWG